MDLDFEVQYKSLMVHHLEKQEIEHELAIRAVQFDPTESRSAIQRRLRDRLKEEKEMNTVDIDFLRSKVTVDAEIKMIDANVDQIRGYLENEVRFEGFKDSLKSRLVHYFARIRRALEYAETDEDLNDLDKLLRAVRGLVNTHFSIFSPIQTVRSEMMQEIVRSVSNLRTGLDDEKNPSKKGGKESQKVSKNVDRSDLRTSEDESDDPLTAQGASGMAKHSNRRELKSDRQTSKTNLEQLSGLLAALFPFGFPQNPNERPRQDVSSDTNRSEKVIRKFALDRRSKSKPIPPAETSDSVVESDQESSTALSDPPVPNRYKNRNHRVALKNRPVSEWNIRYDGKDSGQNLMKFIKEVEFYAKSENVSKRELFRSAIYLFKDQAKSWFMSGVENEDFTNWNELKSELKREFLSPDHDHVTEIKAISRKQGPKERFSDYYMEMQNIFNSLTKPISEGKKFEIINRNLRSDYKGHAVASNIDNLADLKRFGRQLDATFWYKYANSNNNEQNTSRNKTQVNELTRNPEKKSKHQSEDSKKSYKSRNFYRSQKECSDEEQPSTKSSRENPGNVKPKPKTPDHPKDSQSWVDRYVPPTAGICFNCRGQGHHYSECNRPRCKFCLRCGLPDVETKNCPYCAKNFK